MPVRAVPHVLFAITRTQLGGAQRHVLDLMQALAGEVRLSLVTGAEDVRTGHDMLARDARALGADVSLIPSLVHPLSPFDDTRAFAAFVRHLRASRPTLVHAHSSKAGILARLAARFVGVPSLFTAHGWAFTDGAPRRNALIAVPMERLGARVGGAVISVSAYDDRRARAVGLRGPLYVVPNGLADVPERARPGDDGVPVVVMVARFAPPKQQRTVVAALARIDAPWRLRLLGNGPDLEATRDLVAALGVADRVEFFGARDDVPTCVAEAHVAVLASAYEGMPLSIIEAMRAGLPVVASDVGGVPELVVPGETGTLVAPSVDAWTAALRPLLGDPGLRARMGAAGRARYEACFALPRMVGDTLAVYRRLVPSAAWPEDATALLARRPKPAPDAGAEAVRG